MRIENDHQYPAKWRRTPNQPIDTTVSASADGGDQVSTEKCQQFRLRRLANRRKSVRYQWCRQLEKSTKQQRSEWAPMFFGLVTRKSILKSGGLNKLLI
ncbi:unnamed protein product [Lactuca virosa]|uniref:Uncharacterized protein n=1 Tax=Lactuca virosa TaxID=75947 RepID=A0AAU9NMK6_9ASTR|nr:unnamed protein product [Lactuca virosa]